MQRFTVTVEKDNGNQALIVLEPLEQGYGHTLGNSLRRCLLNSIPGAAITSVKINGVAHQFSTIKGVVEDVIQILLNLKKVRIKLYGNKPIRIRLEKSGLGEVKASDIDTLGQGEVVTPDVHIATITDAKTKLEMEMVVKPGVGYLPVEEKAGGEIGSLALDAIFSPVLSVNYTVEQTRVGRRTDFDKLILDVTTDGTLTPLEAVNEAARILSEYFRQIYEPIQPEQPEVEQPSYVNDELLKASVEELDLPVRISNALKAIEVDTVEKLVATPKSKLMRAKNLGTKSIALISEKLSERGLSLSEA